jgi:tether containing UBX domain for GLUT4
VSNCRGVSNVRRSLTNCRSNNKALNLSLPFRQTGLVSGAKLNLVVASKSPVPISVALQLPPAISSVAPGGRLTDKFPSDTTLWLILRKFESTGGANLNFTGRGVPQIDSGASGSGKIVYEMPVLNVMGRELSTFADLQKTLAQLGLSGNILVRLGFRKTEQPLSEAIVTINEYFKEPEGKDNLEPAKEADTVTEAISKLPTDELGAAPEDVIMSESAAVDILPESQSEQSLMSPTGVIANSATEAENAILGPDGQPISVYRAPSNTVPNAALTPHDEADYEPTIAHAKLHQSRLLSNSHNVRLLSDAEAEQQEKERLEKLAKTKEVKIRLRFPDQSSVEAAFDTTKTGADLYFYVTGLIAAEDQPFKLTWFKDKGSDTIPKDDKKLIKDLGFRGSIVVNFVWGDDARESVRRVATLKPQYIEKAKDVPIPQVPGASSIQDSSNSNTLEEKGRGKEAEAPKKKGGVANLSRFVKGLSKK